ncbi:MAG: hypothetical protein CO183_00815 [Candidatus Zambryskibacteria bacterium CG_4_9_14_3_um_filter_42_9]|uniref:Uncharacterized protein n=1 Tax=Candidatus Zambryskibacteria bacterium CG22_combo_CG10-13_8_21_14_all_42_17 TaxID=1975118 RepID=A0A2H0BD15_9BACT|nr:MAG: hypothetical protein COX06_02870 [Candidatus Zambryskibacteria bacterium CG22_combo_CG10-13_8_21_14_all_42_17]PJA36925.1 MAG: hypothetical protein CO183_00815 [Candidatus Zambryskibacteria bacterium CG_4_9_14_3_um_filter_42_9]
MSDKIYLGVAVLIIVAVGFYLAYDWRQESQLSLITNFEECAAAGYPVMESYPEQCRTPDGRLFVRDIENSIIPLSDGENGGDGNGPVACTMEAKICPDGSAVGRTGPNCEFATCPGEESSADPITLVEQLVVPWEIAFLLGGDILVTECSRRLVRNRDDRGWASLQDDCII